MRIAPTRRASCARSSSSCKRRIGWCRSKHAVDHSILAATGSGGSGGSHQNLNRKDSGRDRPCNTSEIPRRGKFDVTAGSQRPRSGDDPQAWRRRSGSSGRQKRSPTMSSFLAQSALAGIATARRACGPSGGPVAKVMKKISYSGYRFPPEIVQQAIWLYLRCTLSFRGKHAALKRMRKLLKKYGFVPHRLITDDLRTYGDAAHDLGIDSHHRRGRWKNNRAENSHQPTRRRERKMQRFKSPAPPRNSSQPTQPSTTPSTYSAISPLPECTAPSAPRR
jgi:hypothetical protein